MLGVLGLAILLSVATANPLCRYVQTTFPTCNTTCYASCTSANCTVACDTGECTASVYRSYNCSDVVYDNTTCPACLAVDRPLACPVENNCVPVCAAASCSWACEPMRSSLCKYPDFELVCESTYCSHATLLTLGVLSAVWF